MNQEIGAIQGCFFYVKSIVSHVKNLIAFHFPINQINSRPCRVKKVSQNLLDLNLISIFFYLEVWSPDMSRNALYDKYEEDQKQQGDGKLSKAKFLS